MSTHMQNKTQADACPSIFSDEFFSDDLWVVQDILSDEFFSDDFWKTKSHTKRQINALDNETRNFLFDPTENWYEKIRTNLVKYFNKKNLHYLAPADSAEDVVSAFLINACKKDKFKDNTHNLKMGNVIYLFRQFLTQERMSKAKCGLYRSKDVSARTDQEQRLKKEGKNLRAIKNSFADVKEVHWERDGETGVVEGFEIASHHSNPEEELEKNEVKEIIFEEFSSASKTEAEANQLYDIFVDLAEKNYRTDQAWADNLGVEVSELKRLKFKVKNTIKNSNTLRDMYS